MRNNFNETVIELVIPMGARSEKEVGDKVVKHLVSYNLIHKTACPIEDNIMKVKVKVKSMTGLAKCLKMMFEMMNDFPKATIKH